MKFFYDHKSGLNKIADADAIPRSDHCGAKICKR